jgi:putative transposase
MSALITTALDDAVAELVGLVGKRAACQAVGLPRASYYRANPVTGPAVRPGAESGAEPGVEPVARARQVQPRALSEAERATVLEVMHSERFADTAPASVYATLLDEGTYLCSQSTMYRLLRECGEVRERRRQASHPAKVKPELVATQANEVWSWDITKLRGPAKWTWFHLYVILDIYSRYPVGWMVASRESDVLAERLIAESVRKQQVDRDQLTLHADRGSSMASKTVALLLADLGVTKSHSRPHVSNDNPYSEAQFKTLKYRPDFPDRFGSIEDARVFCDRFFRWYAHEHRHSGLGLHTPADVHYGRAHAVRDARGRVLDTAYQATPERFVRKPPQPPELPTAAWINRPADKEDQAQ